MIRGWSIGIPQKILYNYLKIILILPQHYNLIKTVLGYDKKEKNVQELASDQDRIL